MSSKKIIYSSCLFLILLSVIFCSEPDTNSFDENVKKNKAIDALNEHLESISNIIKVYIMDALSNNVSLITKTYESVEINDDNYVLEYVGDSTGKYGEGSIFYDKNKKYNYRTYLDIENELQKMKGEDDKDDDAEGDDNNDDDEEGDDNNDDEGNDNDKDDEEVDDNDKDDDEGDDNDKDDDAEGDDNDKDDDADGDDNNDDDADGDDNNDDDADGDADGDDNNDDDEEGDDNETCSFPKKNVHKHEVKLNNESKTNLRRQEHKEQTNQYPNNECSAVQISIVTVEDFLRKVKERNKKRNNKKRPNAYDSDEETERSENTSKVSYSSDPSTIDDENENCILYKQSSDIHLNINNDNTDKHKSVNNKKNDNSNNEKNSDIYSVPKDIKKNREKNHNNDNYKPINQESLSTYFKDNMKKNNNKNNPDLYNIKKDNDPPEFEESDKFYNNFSPKEYESFSMVTTSRYENKTFNDNYKNYNFNEQERTLIKNMIDIFIYTYKLNYANNKSISKLFKDSLLKKVIRTYFRNYIYTLFNYEKTYKFLTPYNKDNDHMYRQIFDEAVQMMDLLINKIHLTLNHMKL
ncbi:MSP7-like protein [Plasmodium sp. gorilla clade G3]|nr:MSP7-like protein [Plasmodium sp. gorilla clade G3]